MEWTFGEEGILRLALIGAGGWIANYIRPKILPWMKERVRTWKNTERIDKLEAEIKALKSRLTIEENTMKAIIRTAPDGMYFADPKGNMKEANAAWFDMTGFSRETDAYETGYMEAIAPHHEKMIKDAREDLAAHPRSWEKHVDFINLETGSLSETITRSELIKDDNDTVVKVLGRNIIIKIVKKIGL